MKEMGNERIVPFQFLHYMKRLSVSLAGILMAAALDLPAASWLSDFPAAQAKAGAENRMILMNFTGSDWCSWCVKLREEVFSTAEFNAFADQKLVLVEVDFPKRKRQRPELQKANRLLAGSFQVEGYPTIILLDSSGKRIGNSGYRPGGPKVFLSELESLSGGKLKAATALATFSIALMSPEATASTRSPESATPRGTARPWRAASPSPTALDPYSDASRAFAKATTLFTRAP